MRKNVLKIELWFVKMNIGNFRLPLPYMGKESFEVVAWNWNLSHRFRCLPLVKEISGVLFFSFRGPNGWACIVLQYQSTTPHRNMPEPTLTVTLWFRQLDYLSSLPCVWSVAPVRQLNNYGKSCTSATSATGRPCGPSVLWFTVLRFEILIIYQ